MTESNIFVIYYFFRLLICTCFIVREWRACFSYSGVFQKCVRVIRFRVVASSRKWYWKKKWKRKYIVVCVVLFLGTKFDYLWGFHGFPSGLRSWKMDDSAEKIFHAMPLLCALIKIASFFSKENIFYLDNFISSWIQTEKICIRQICLLWKFFKNFAVFIFYFFNLIIIFPIPNMEKNFLK